MYLSEALTKLKNLKSRVSRVEGYIESAAVHYEDEVPEHDYESEMVTRAGLNNDILHLKTRILLTNANTIVTYNGNPITLAQLILLNAKLRTELAFIMKQLEHSTTGESLYGSARTKDNIKRVFAKGCDKASFKRAVDQLERDKEELERVMAQANATTTLV